jgi:hypothetical protein
MVEITDAIRAQAVERALAQAENDVGLNSGKFLAVGERCERILAAATPGNLEPRLYGLAYFLRKEARKKNMN